MRPSKGAVVFSGATFLAFATALGAYLLQSFNQHWQDTETRLDLLLRENIIAIDLLFRDQKDLAAAIAVERGVAADQGPIWVFSGGSGADRCDPADPVPAIASKSPAADDMTVGQASMVADQRIFAPIQFDLGPDLRAGACVNLSKIMGWWQTIEWPAGAAVALIRDSREILIRHPFLESFLNKDISGGPLIDSIATIGPDSGAASFKATQTDNVVRRVAWRASPSTNLILVAGFSDSTVNADWWEQTQATAYAVTAVGVLSTIFVLVTATSRARSREHVILSEARLKAATDAGGMGVWDFDPTTGALHWDPGMFALYQIRDDQFSGLYEAWRAAVHPHDVEAAERELEDAIEHQRPFDTRFRIVLPDGSHRWLSAEAKLITNEAGKVVRLVGVNRDITEEFEARENLMAARQNAERANAAKSDFLAAMSHELRTPLNAICGFSEILQRELFGKLGNDKYRDYVGHVNSSAQHLLSLVNNVLDLSRIEAGEMPVVAGRFDLAAVIRDCVHMVGYRHDRTAEDVSLDIEPAQIVIESDARAVRQVLLNLLANADKYTPAGGAISLRARQAADGEVIVTLSDTGIGIPVEDIETVLEPFAQSRQRVELAHEGTGLGLSLSSKLMQLMGGSLKIDSTEKRGTTITLTFPPTLSDL